MVSVHGYGKFVAADSLDGTPVGVKVAMSDSTLR